MRMEAAKFDRSAAREAGFLRLVPAPAPPPKRRRRTHDGENAREILTNVQQADAGKLVATLDLFDRAHTIMGADLMLIPAAIENRAGVRLNRLVRSRARRYHPSQLTSQGVAFDSAFDAWWALATRLAGQTIRLVPRAGVDALAVAVAAAEGDDIRLRDILHKATRVRLTERERALEAEASEMLRRAGEAVEDDA